MADQSDKLAILDLQIHVLKRLLFKRGALSVNVI